MLFGIIILLLGAFIGNLISNFSGLPVPGTVFGILLVLIYLTIIKKVPHSLKQVSDGLLKYLALFYVPAGVGLVSYLELLAADWGKILIALLVSSIITIIAIAVIMDKVAKLFLARSEQSASADSVTTNSKLGSK